MTTAPPATDVQTLMFADDGVVPNNPDLPVVLMPGAIDPGSGAAGIRARMQSNGWGGTWTYTVFDYHHYHPNAHEALIVASGWADIQLGGSSGPTLRVTEGDAMVLPAGTGHCRIAASPDFAICGGYPPGQEDYEIVRATPANRGDAARRIAEVPLPVTDPVFGASGPVLTSWCAVNTAN